MDGDIVNGVLVASITALTIGVVLWMGKVAGRWLVKNLARTFGEQVVEVMAPDMARLGTRLGSAVDELRIANHAEHTEVQHRLGGVENRLTDVEHRLTTIEHRLDIRPPEARTRVTDKED